MRAKIQKTIQRLFSISSLVVLLSTGLSVVASDTLPPLWQPVCVNCEDTLPPICVDCKKPEDTLPPICMKAFMP